MGRRRKSPIPLPFITVASDDPAVGEKRARLLNSHMLKHRGRPGRPARLDRMRAALFAADQHPPTPAGTKRQRRCRGAQITPRREANATELLQSLLEPAGRVIVDRNDRPSKDQQREALERVLTEAILTGNRGNSGGAVEALRRLDMGTDINNAGELLTPDNLTRIIEQARRLIVEAEEIEVH